MVLRAGTCPSLAFLHRDVPGEQGCGIRDSQERHRHPGAKASISNPPVPVPTDSWGPTLRNVRSKLQAGFLSGVVQVSPTSSPASHHPQPARPRVSGCPTAPHPAPRVFASC